MRNISLHTSILWSKGVKKGISLLLACVEPVFVFELVLGLGHDSVENAGVGVHVAGLIVAGRLKLEDAIVNAALTDAQKLSPIILEASIAEAA